jgi:hypothetical protein
LSSQPTCCADVVFIVSLVFTVFNTGFITWAITVA